MSRNLPADLPAVYRARVTASWPPSPEFPGGHVATCYFGPYNSRGAARFRITWEQLHASPWSWGTDDRPTITGEVERSPLVWTRLEG